MRLLLREGIETIALVIFVFLLFSTTIQNYVVEGNSMLPNLEHSDRILANKVTYLNVKSNGFNDFLPWVDEQSKTPWYLFGSPERGDVVIFKSPENPGQHFVKRLIGLPGDVVWLDGAYVRINGELLPEEYEMVETHIPSHQPVTVPDGEYYVLGDNRLQSEDSRSDRVGTIPAENIVGKVWFGYWPLNRVNVLLSKVSLSSDPVAQPGRASDF